MKKPYECYTYYEYRKLLFKDACYKFRRIIYAESADEALQKYSKTEGEYDTKPYDATKILKKEYEVYAYKGNLQELKEEMNYDDYLQMIKDRINAGVGVDAKLL